MENGFNIKPELLEAFKIMAGGNCLDSYSFAGLSAALKVMESLDNGDDCKTAHDKMYGMGLTGFLAGCASEIVSKYHIRGDEYRIFWNQSFGVSEEQAKGGIVNPAIMSIGK